MLYPAELQAWGCSGQGGGEREWAEGGLDSRGRADRGSVRSGLERRGQGWRGMSGVVRREEGGIRFVGEEGGRSVLAWKVVMGWAGYREDMGGRLGVGKSREGLGSRCRTRGIRTPDLRIRNPALYPG